MQIFLNDRLVDESEAMVSVFDHGFLYGDGVYETMRAYEGVVFSLDEHLGRLGRSASLIRMQIPGRKFIAGAVYETIRANGLSNAYVRVTLSRGKGPIGLDPALCKKPTLVIIAELFKPYPVKLYQDGVFLVISPVIRNHVRAINPMIKSLNFLNNILAKADAIDRGAYEAIMLNTEDNIAEGTVCNIFFVKDGSVCTPSVDAGILDGITREIVISLARKSGLPVHEGLFSPADILSATEVFFTNTTAEVMPVSRVDDTAYAVGSVSQKLRKLYQAEVRHYVHLFRDSQKEID
ncbi:MAG: branched-chain amino acid aminotransferase [Thermodesulfovibrio sp.]|nr:branched-chain amino acid aminotransferase [Thermodesulfovibrio sp.]